METIEFGGRRFSLIVGGTIERDIELGNRIDASGVKEAIFANVRDEEAMNRAIAQALCTSSKRLFEIIGAAVVPDGTDPLQWDADMMRATAQFFAKLDSKDTQRLLVCAVAMVRAFFLVELVSMAISRKSSTLPVEVDQLSNPGASGATSTSDTGV